MMHITFSKKYPVYFVCVMFCLFILYSGCSAISNGTNSSFTVPGKTKTDSRGQQQILDQIEWLSRNSTGEKCELKVLNTKFVEKELNTDIEHWLIEYCGKQIKYKVRITHYHDGSKKYSVTYPKAYE